MTPKNMSLNSSTVIDNQDAEASQYNNLRKDIIENAGQHGTVGGTGDAITLAVDAQITAYAAGQKFRFQAGAANTGAVTLNVNSLGAKTIKKNNNEDLVSNDIESGQEVEVVYDGTNMQMLTPLSTSNLTSGFINGGETIDGTTAPVLAYLKKEDGELYKSDASYSDQRSNVLGYIINSVTDGNPAALVLDGILLIPSVTMTSAVSSTLDQNTDVTTNSNIISLDSVNDYYSQLFQVGEQVGNISSIKLKGKQQGANTRSYVLDIYAVDSDGKPTGASLGTSDVTSDNGASDSFVTFNFTTPVSVTPGDILCWVISPSGTAPDAVNHFILRNQTDVGKNYNVIKQGTTSGYNFLSYNSTDAGSTWNIDSRGAVFQTYTTLKKYCYGDPILLSETAGEYTLDYPTGTGAAIRKVGRLLSQTKLKIDLDDSLKFLGSTTTGGDYDGNTVYFAVPPHAQQAIIKVNIPDGAGNTLYKTELIILRKYKTTANAKFYDSGGYCSIELTWTGNVIKAVFSADIDAISAYFYGF